MKHGIQTNGGANKKKTPRPIGGTNGKKASFPAAYAAPRAGEKEKNADGRRLRISACVETKSAAQSDVPTARKKYRVIVIGGGAAGLFFAAKYGDRDVLVLEKGDRVGRKLSATGGGWGNVSNVHAVSAEGYFTFEESEKNKIDGTLRAFPCDSLRRFLRDVGCVTFADERGRVYPTSRQASSLTDCLRAEAARRGTRLLTGEEVLSVRLFTEENGASLAEVKTKTAAYVCENVLLCAGGKAAKNFGTDGGGYALAQSLGAQITPVYPALVQLKCAEREVRALKGIRAFDSEITLLYGGKTLAKERGDVLFTEFGVSGDGVFRISSYLPYGETGEIFTSDGLSLSIDFLPDINEETLKTFFAEKKSRYPDIPAEELPVGVVNNRLARTVVLSAERKCGDGFSRLGVKGIAAALAAEIKRFSMSVTGTLGFDYAQVTKGGVRLSQVNEDFSLYAAPNVYFAGEILDVDGACGGYNLQWAYATACAAGNGMQSGAKEKR